MTWIDWTIIGIVAAAVVGIIGYLIHKKKTGKGGCGCGCDGCPHAGACHPKKDENGNENA